MRLNTGAQLALDNALRDLRLVQHTLTDAAIDTNTVSALKRTCAAESDALRAIHNTIRAILATSNEETS